jgi:20S proteasome subunit beta 3
MFILLLFFFSDLRLGIQAQTVTKDFEKVFRMNEKLYVGLTGLATDVLSVCQTLTMKCNLYKLQENREIKPLAFAGLLSTLLYEKRYFNCFC